jgi:phenylacetate-CoA ligase
MQQLFVSLYGWWWYRRRHGRHFHEYVAQLLSQERWTAEQFRRYQEELLAAVLQAAQHSLYYKQVFREASITAGMPPFEALQRMPFLSKETLRTRGRDLLTQTPPRGSLVLKSSGTTGTPTEIYYSHDFQQLSIAWIEARSKRWAALSFRDRRIMFGVRKVCSFEQSKPPFWRYSPAENMAYMSIYHLSPAFMPAYLNFLKEYQPQLIMGYPSAIYTLGRFALENRQLPPPAKAVITTSETVTPLYRETIESAWQCRLYDSYGTTEGCFYASECEHGRMHLSPDVGIFEILDPEGKPCPPGVVGAAVCTGLHNRLQPLIRYQIGDAVAWSPEASCPCGREMPILQAIEGRIEDMCYTLDGRAMLRFDTVFKGITEIREAQVIQKRLDHFVIKMVPTQNFSKLDEEKIRENMWLHAGRVKVEIIAVPQILRTKGNKFRAVISQLSTEERKALRERNIPSY